MNNILVAVIVSTLHTEVIKWWQMIKYRHVSTVFKNNFDKSVTLSWRYACKTEFLFCFWCRSLSWVDQSVCQASWPWISRLPQGPCGSWEMYSSGGTTLCSTETPIVWGLPPPSRLLNSCLCEIHCSVLMFFLTFTSHRAKLNFIVIVALVHLQQSKALNGCCTSLQDLACHINISLRMFILFVYIRKWLLMSKCGCYINSLDVLCYWTKALMYSVSCICLWSCFRFMLHLLIWQDSIRAMHFKVFVPFSFL